MTLSERTLTTPDQSFFLFGPRGVGKTTWLKAHFKSEIGFNLLLSKDFLELSKDPSYLAARIGKKPKGTWVIIDEIQKLPILLDEVHHLIEENGYRFVLTGSSARKLKRSGANLLAGRAITRNMYQFTSREWPGRFDLTRALNWGGLPLSVQAKEPKEILESYFFTYIKEEIQEEGLVRQIDPFVRFLEVAGNANGQVLNVENIARETGSKRVTIDKWFLILEDTLVAYRLPAWRPGFKVRETAHPKFYWFDPGVARAAAGRLFEEIDSAWLGWSYETWLLHETRAYNSYSRSGKSLYYYSLPSGIEIDLIVELKKGSRHSPPEIVGMEFKSAKKWKREWEEPLRELSKEKNLKVKKMIGVYQGQEKLEFDDFTVYPTPMFLDLLHSGKIY